MPQFWLGVHRPNWLEQTAVPLFISRRVLIGRRTMPHALGTWALDSGGFTEISLYGAWETSPADYARDVLRFMNEIGGLAWAAQQDWMCEPFMLRRTGLTIAEHQRRTVENFITFREVAPDVPWVPVLQGWSVDDYLRHMELFEQAGVDLSRERLVGVGSVCRRQHTSEVAALFRRLFRCGLSLHGFGVKLRGLMASLDVLASSDSMAWSFRARRSDPLPGHAHRNCANCLEYAVRWRTRIMCEMLSPKPVQFPLEFGS